MINQRRVVSLSWLLFLFTIPHVLEDFATGQPGKSGMPASILAVVIALIFSLQGLGLFWLGQKRRRGMVVHLLIGLFWPVASGVTQLPAILSGTPYRSGNISIFYVAGMIVFGLLLMLASFASLRSLGKSN